MTFQSFREHERWINAKKHLDYIVQSYIDIGASGQLALVVTIFPLRTRFAKGERTDELHDEIMVLE